MAISKRPRTVQILGAAGVLLCSASILFGRPAQPWLILAAIVMFGVATLILVVHSVKAPPPDPITERPL